MLPSAVRPAALAAACLTLLSACLPAAASAQAPPAGQVAVTPAATAGDVSPDAFWDAVASRVGVSPEALRSAVRDVRSQYLAARRKAFAARLAQQLGGSITADQVLAAFETVRRNGVAPEAMVGTVARQLGVSPDALRAALAQAAPARPWLRMRMAGPPLLESAGTYLGMAPEALMAELAKGQSLAQVAQARGKSVAGLEAALQEAAAGRIHALVQMPWPSRPEGAPPPVKRPAPSAP